ncbi:MAG: efflux RND transporter periplasmic adaptor subunit [Myxococcota bacterium]
MTLLLLLAACGVEAQAPHAGHGDALPAGEHAGHGEPQPAERATPDAVTVAPDIAAALGVRTVPARGGDAAPTHRAPASSSFDPTRTTRVTLIAGGQVRELRVPRVGEAVQKGAVLARAWLPEVRAAFEELVLARPLGEPWGSAARGRLLALGVPAGELDVTEVPETWTVRSPVSGLVVSRPVREGGWLGPGGVVAEIASADARVVELVTSDPPPAGTDVTLVSGATTWRARVTEVLPTASPAGRSVRLAVEGDPPVGTPLTATWAGEPSEGVWVPRGAVVDTGARQVVFVVTAGGYAPRAVELGVRTDDEVQVLSGLEAGEQVVAAGTFLFDAETQMTGGGHAGMDMGN